MSIDIDEVFVMELEREIRCWKGSNQPTWTIYPNKKSANEPTTNTTTTNHYWI